MSPNCRNFKVRGNVNQSPNLQTLQNKILSITVQIETCIPILSLFFNILTKHHNAETVQRFIDQPRYSILLKCSLRHMFLMEIPFPQFFLSLFFFLKFQSLKRSGNFFRSCFHFLGNYYTVQILVSFRSPESSSKIRLSRRSGKESLTKKNQTFCFIFSCSLIYVYSKDHITKRSLNVTDSCIWQ